MRRQRSGFVLLTVLVMLVILGAGVSIALQQVQSGVEQGGMSRAQALTEGALEQGLNAALDRLETIDPAQLGDPTTNWDIFDQPSPAGGGDFVPPSTYPATGPYANTIEIRVGLRPGQRTRAPEGEDVLAGVGQIFEIQLSARSTIPGNEAEERASVGVTVPMQLDHSN